MQLFARITKVDETLHEVHGRIAEEIPDSIGEIMDYAMSKPRFQEWSEDFEAAIVLAIPPKLEPNRPILP